MKYILLVILLLALSPVPDAAAQESRPKIGLALSGGGAKGLAHIGILKALDSAGIRIDYITGTSMGSIIGALYAIGYSAAEIERMARKVHWDEVLTNHSPLSSIVMEEKDEYSRYALELPWVDRRFRIPQGVLESEELWLRFAEMFFPVYNVKDFGQFSIPFKCVSADVVTGEAVVLDSGEIVSAIRSSMAIPTLFTPIEYQGRFLIDGGVVRNFPVRDVRNMGADYIIGSRVSMGLKPREKITNALQVLMQIVFFREAATIREEMELCDFYIPMPFEQYTAASFNRASAILDSGLARGRALYPAFRRLADSLDARYGPAPPPADRLPLVDSIRITDIRVNGLERTTRDFFQHMMVFEQGGWYTAARLSRMVRRVFGTRYYSRVLYRLEPLEDGSARIVFDVVENPQNFAKLGVHFNNFMGISLIANLTTRNLFLPHSRSLLTLNLGEHFRVRGEHLQYLGRDKAVALVLTGQYDDLNITTYERFRRDGLYDMKVLRAEGRLQFSASRTFTIGVGNRYESVRYEPVLRSTLDLSGRNTFSTGFGFFEVNTLNRRVFPVRGLRLKGEMGFVYNQRPRLTYFQDGEPVPHVDSLGISYSDYNRALLQAEGYIPLSSRTTLSTRFQSGVNFRYRQNILNDFNVGGLYETFRNQILFAGLEENTLNTPSVAVIGAGLRYELLNNLFVSGRAEALVNNFVSRNNLLQKPDFVSGYALGMAYAFALGPLEIGAMFNDRTGRLRSYINLGVPF